ncbi:polypyrimidine tract-binding protein 1-like [Tripterygium wilfordii]|uniref:Polypyrimidine tract-binding protein 1-like n=1 Tax=Tripterygium wilfordii TaxID=458696 RepID=A0A7J7BTW6_TRIWF|nr:polypyrimidine tract-binding protein 1-like [Tripterygium wilfordii]
MHQSTEYAARAAAQSQVPHSQVPSWDPNPRAARPGFVSAPSTYPGQTYPTSPVPAYGHVATPLGSSPLSQSSPMSPAGTSMRMPQLGIRPNFQPGESSTPGVDELRSRYLHIYIESLNE